MAELMLAWTGPRGGTVSVGFDDAHFGPPQIRAEFDFARRAHEEVLLARPGDLVFKPRGVAHAFWNPADEPARALEIISPAGFERYFAELAPLFPPANQGLLDEEAVGAVRENYGLEMDMGSIPVLVERHGLLVDAPPPSGK